MTLTPVSCRDEPISPPKKQLMAIHQKLKRGLDKFLKYVDITKNVVLFFKKFITKRYKPTYGSVIPAGAKRSAGISLKSTVIEIDSGIHIPVKPE
jgi:hypothetical protein